MFLIADMVKFQPKSCSLGVVIVMAVLMVGIVAVILTQWLNNGNIQAVESSAVLSVLLGIISIAILLMMALLLGNIGEYSNEFICFLDTVKQ